MARPSCARIAPPEQLELRILPTVKVNFNPNSGLLKITGDNADNRIDIDGFGVVGDMEIFVDSTLFNTYSGVNSIKVKLKGGNDRLLMNAFSINGSLTANLGKGADEFDIDDVVNFGTGPDGVVSVVGKVQVNLGGDVGDLFDLDGYLVFGDDVLVKGAADVDINGNGSTFNYEPGNDILFQKSLNIQFGQSGDVDGDTFSLDIDNMYLTGNLSIKGSSLVDRAQFTDNTFGGTTTILLSGGDDSLDLDNGAADKNRFFGDFLADGQTGIDTIDIDAENLFLGINTAIFENSI